MTARQALEKSIAPSRLFEIQLDDDEILMEGTIPVGRYTA